MNQIFTSSLSIILSLIFLGLLFIPMEKVFAAKKQKVFRPFWRLDLMFFIGQYLVWGGLVVFILKEYGVHISNIVPTYITHSISKQAQLIQAFEVIILSDFFIYWAHRLQHNNNFLWRFHKVHHTSKHLDWLAAHREHPLDTIYTMGIINLPAFLLGFDLTALSFVITFRGIWAIYIHSNIKLNIGPIKKLIGSPDIHHWHHSKERHVGNYANISPLMDIIFGTYFCPKEEPESFGIKEKTPTSYVGQMVNPFLPKKWSLKLFKRQA